MASMVVGQIHDSMVADVKVEEFGRYLEIVENVTAVGLPKHYPFLVVSPQVGYEVAPVGGNWYQKIEFGFKGGFFYLLDDPKDLIRDPLRFLEMF